MISIYFLINAIETAFLTLYFAIIGSESSQQVIFNLSWYRFIVVVFFMFVTGTFLFLFIQCLKKQSKLKDRIVNILNDQRLTWILLTLNTLLLAISLILLTQSAEKFGNLKNYFLQFQPVLSWIFLLSGQAIFFLVVRMSFFFNSLNKGHSSETRKEFRVVWIIFAASVIAKFALVTRTAYGLINWDEMEYFFSAYFLHQGNLYLYEDAIHYPPLYSALLIPSIPFGVHVYDLIKIMNVLLSSSIVFPIYLVARQFLSAKESTWITIISCLLPFHLVFPGRVQSENLYYPLFCWAVYMVIAAPRNTRFRLSWDILTGVVLGMLYLTRYITLAALPAFFLGWWLKPFQADQEKSWFSPKKLLHFGALLLATLLTYSPWLLMGLKHGYTLKMLLGLFITSDVVNPAQLSFANLMKWVLIYGSYLILMAAPVLHLIFLSIRQTLRDKLDLKTRNWFILVLTLLGSYSAAVIRHSWRANYNVDLPTKIMGRYFIFLTPLFLITAGIALGQFKREKWSSPARYFISTIVIPYALVVFAYLCIVTKSIIPISKSAVKIWGAVDGYLVSILGWRFLLIVLLIFMATAIFLWRGKKERSFSFLITGLVVFYLIGLPTYYRKVQVFNPYNLIGKQVAEQISVRYPDDYSSRDIQIYLPDQFTKSQKQRIYMSARIRGLHQLALSTYTQDYSFTDFSAGDFILVENDQTTKNEEYQYRLIEIPLSQ